MTTIKLKIAQEDKRIMLQVFDTMRDCEKVIETANDMIVYETTISIKSKLNNSLHNNKLSLSMIEVIAFRQFLKTYEMIGVYEASNAMLLLKQIEDKLRAKFITHNS